MKNNIVFRDFGDTIAIFGVYEDAQYGTYVISQVMYTHYYNMPFFHMERTWGISDT